MQSYIALKFEETGGDPLRDNIKPLLSLVKNRSNIEIV